MLQKILEPPVKPISSSALETYRKPKAISTPQEIIHNPVDNNEPPVENYILTEENFQKIDPMIGIREEDIKGIFK